MGDNGLDGNNRNKELGLQGVCQMPDDMGRDQLGLRKNLDPGFVKGEAVSKGEARNRSLLFVP